VIKYDLADLVSETLAKICPQPGIIQRLIWS